MSDSPKPELSPCPFCGGPALLYTVSAYRKLYAARCGKCGTERQPASLIDSAVGWNRRFDEAGWLPIETAPKPHGHVFYVWKWKSCIAFPVVRLEDSGPPRLASGSAGHPLIDMDDATHWRFAQGP